MKHRDILVIFAAGRATRFGGFPKAFCNIGKKKNVENTLEIARPYFDEIYVIVNKETEGAGYTDELEAKIISIVTGQGDADSIRKSLTILKQNGVCSDYIYACWGDAVFISSKPFEEMKASVPSWSDKSPVLVGCSRDDSPYAWFDVDDRNIVESHFRNKESTPCTEGIHDQSIFVIRIDETLNYLNEYRVTLGLNKYDEDTYEKNRGEMGFLNSFSWIYKNKGVAASWCYISDSQVKSFNTEEELEMLKAFLQKKTRGRI